MSRYPYVILGKVVKAHGIRGEVQVYPYTFTVDSFIKYGPLSLIAIGGREQKFQVLRARKKQKRKIILTLEGVNSRDQAEALVGSKIAVPRERLPELSEGEYYWQDLIGMEVRTVTGEVVGRVKQILATGAHDILIIRGTRGEVLIPAVAQMIDNIDLEGRVITVDPVPGLLDVNAL